jgi:hypothetical protein
MNADLAQVNYLRWLSDEHPALYNRAIRGAQLRVSRAGLAGDEEGLGWINLVIQAVGIAAGAAVQKKQIDKSVALQKKAMAADDAQRAADRDAMVKLQLLEVNTKRAAAGLPPVDITGKVIPGAALPTPSALAPIIPIAQGGGQSTLLPGVPNYVTYGVGGLAALGIVWAVVRR